MKTINLKAIRIDGGTQSRASLNEAVVAEYAEQIEKLPPVVLFFDGAEHWLADGFHRYHAFAKAGRAGIPADVRTGTCRDAKLFSVGANGTHGLRRTNEDKRRAVLTLLEDSEWSQWSDRKIAEACGVSDKTVAACRAAIFGNSEDAEGAGPKPVVRTVERAGKVFQQDTSNIGRKTASAPLEVPRSAPAATPAPQPAPEANQAPSDDGPSLDELIDDLQRENKTLQAQVAALSKGDTNAELSRYVRMYEDAQRKQSELMEKVMRRDRELQKQANTLKRICTAVGEENPSKVAQAVETMVKKMKVDA